MSLDDDQTRLRKALGELGHAVGEALGPLGPTRLTPWLDRQLRRWPWLYRKLGGEA